MVSCFACVMYPRGDTVFLRPSRRCRRQCHRRRHRRLLVFVCSASPPAPSSWPHTTYRLLPSCLCCARVRAEQFFATLSTITGVLCCIILPCPLLLIHSHGGSITACANHLWEKPTRTLTDWHVDTIDRRDVGCDNATRPRHWWAPRHMFFPVCLFPSPQLLCFYVCVVTSASGATKYPNAPSHVVPTRGVVLALLFLLLISFLGSRPRMSHFCISITSERQTFGVSTKFFFFFYG